MSKDNTRGRRTFLAMAGGAAVASMMKPRAAASAAVSSKIQAPTGLKNGADHALLPPFSVRVLNRMGFGPARRSLHSLPAADPEVLFGSGFETPRLDEALGEDDVTYFESLGFTDDDRLATYVEEQLDPNLPDPEVEARMAAYPSAFATLSEPLAVTFDQRECSGFSAYSRPLREVEAAAFTRAVYSRRQLFELMADFWHNHLNVFGGADEDTYVSWASWDRDVIRANTLGNFYEMLIASAQHPAMLEYLDNYANSVGGINENYARELFELHTMGAENYRETTSPFDVEMLAENPYWVLNDPDLSNPLLGGIGLPANNVPIARYFVDDDVYSAAEALTGWRYDDDNTNVGDDCFGGTGAFFTDESEHSGNIAKAVLTMGQARIPSDRSAADEGRLVIKLAAYHPGTATYIARKLCRRLIADDPPESVVQAAAQTFFEHRLSSDQIARTLRTILLSDEFKDAAGWGQKIKRPFEHAVSAMRAAGCNHTWREDDSDTDSFLSIFEDAGQELFWWRTPDGYPDRRDHWQGSTTLVRAWRTIDWLMDRNASDAGNRIMRVLNLTLANLPGNPTPRDLAEFWANWTQGFSPAGGWMGPPGTLYSQAPTAMGRAAMQFMTQQGFSGANDAAVWPSDEPIDRNDLSSDSSPYYWHRRLRGMVALMLWSPQFMQR